LPLLLPDYRDTVEALVHKDLRVSFDGNRYCVPPRYVGRKLTVKADASSVAIYDKHQEIVRYARCWERGQTFGAERFQKELFAQMAAPQRSDAQRSLVALLGLESEQYLRRLVDTDRVLSRGSGANSSNPAELLEFASEPSCSIGVNRSALPLLTRVRLTERWAPNCRSRHSAVVIPAKPPPRMTTRVLAI
jgi:hypothetical protein